MKDRLFSKSCVEKSSLCYALCFGGFISKNIAVTCAAPKLSHSMPSTGSHEGGLVRFDTINCSVMFGCHAGTALPGRHAALRGVNSQTAEQFFSWVDPFVRFVVNMTPAVFEVFLLLVTHFYNTTICASVGPSARLRAHRPRPAPSRRAPRAAAAGAGEPARGEAAAPPPPRLNFRRNPHGVGFWGAGKYHWEVDPAAPRPPCKIVDNVTLTETLQESVDAVDFLPQVGYVLVNAAGKHELCKVCARAMQRAGLL
jgi:hypothetical protein